MKVYLDTARREKKLVKIDEREFETAGSALSLLREKIADPSKIDKVEFNHGPGSSFTGLKVGASIANAINYSLGIISPQEAELPNYGAPFLP